MTKKRLSSALNRAGASTSEVSDWVRDQSGLDLFHAQSIDKQVQWIQEYQAAKYCEEDDPMEFTTVQTNDLYGPALSWAVASIDQPEWSDKDAMLFIDDEYRPQEGNSALRIIESNPSISLVSLASDDSTKRRCAYYTRDGGAFCSYANTSIQAFLRAFVHRDFGDRIEIPAELVPERQGSKELHSNRPAG